MEYINIDVENTPNFANHKKLELTMLLSKLKPALLLDITLLKVKEAIIKYTAEKKRNIDTHIRKLEQERLCASDFLTRETWKPKNQNTV